MDTPTPSSPSRPAASSPGKPAAPSPRKRPARRRWRSRGSRPYHYGDLRNAAIAQALVVAARGGPNAVTLRGIARDLGVTAPALVYYFRSIAGFRAAVAATVLERAGASSGAPVPRADAGVAVSQAPPPRGWARPAIPSPVVAREAPAVRTPRAVADAWIEFAAANPALYRLASGEGWHGSPRSPNGWHGTTEPVPSPRLALEQAFRRMTRRLGRPGGDVGLARELACTVHGLALGRIDGLPGDFVGLSLDRVVRDPPEASQPA